MQTYFLAGRRVRRASGLKEMSGKPPRRTPGRFLTGLPRRMWGQRLVGKAFLVGVLSGSERSSDEAPATRQLFSDPGWN